MKICSTCEGNSIHSSFMYVYSQVLHILTGTEDMGPQFLICQVDLFEDDRKMTPSADCSFLYVCCLMVGTYCNWGLTVYNKQCQPLGHNNRPLWNPENYTLALSSIIRFSTAPAYIAQQSEGNIFTRRNYLCARPEEGTNINLKSIWAITGTKELGPIKFCQGQQSMDKGKINSRFLLVSQSYIQNFSEI